MKSNTNPEETKPSSKSTVNEPTIPMPKKAAKKTAKSELPSAEAPIAVEAESELPVKKRKYGGWVALGILVMLLIVAAGILLGYASAINVRKAEETTQRLVAATTQYELSLQDIQNSNLSMAKQRLEYIIQIYPTYPDAGTKLAEVMVAMAQSNPTGSTAPAIATVQPTKDTRGAAAIFIQAKQQYAAQDWQNLYTSILSLRDLDPTYEAVQVDDMYYVALRNVGVNAIKNGNLEVGLYHFAVAEQIGPIDTDAEAYRVWAKMYLNSASNWGVNWGKVVLGFSELYPLVPNLIDFNGKTVKQRYAEALAGYGDSLEALYQWCDAVTQYETSTGIASIQTVIDKLPEARANCANPPNTPTPAEIATP